MVAIEGVATAANESASGTSDIADRAMNINYKTNDVRNQVLRTRDSAARLKKEIDKFKI